MSTYYFGISGNTVSEDSQHPKIPHQAKFFQGKFSYSSMSQNCNTQHPQHEAIPGLGSSKHGSCPV